VQAPRICSVPPAVSSLGREAVELGASAGVHLDEWQAFALERSMGLRGDGKWAAFEAAVNVARQNGKNEIALVRELAGLFLLNEQLLIHSAHEFKTSTEHQRRIEEVIQDTPEMHKRVKPKGGYRHSHGEESIELRTGQRIRFMTRTKGGGRGHTGDLVVFDEAMILAAAMLGALMPTLSARSVLGNPQLWYFFTAVDQMIQEHGVVAAKLRERALAGGDPSLAYLEWSVKAKDPEKVSAEMAVDQRLWAEANPALGIRISAEHIANEQRSMDARTFAVERLGVGDWPSADGSGSVIDMVRWALLEDGRSKMVDPVALAFDVTPDRAYASVSAAGRRADGLRHVEVIERRRGTGWVAARLAELDRVHSPRVVVCDSAGAAMSLVPEVEAAGVRVTKTSTREHAEACGVFFDSVEQSTLRHLGTPDLDAAVRGARRRRVGGAWLWDRADSLVDIGPLVSCTLALWGLSVEQTSVYEERGLLVVSPG